DARPHRPRQRVSGRSRACRTESRRHGSHEDGKRAARDLDRGRATDSCDPRERGGEGRSPTRNGGMMRPTILGIALLAPFGCAHTPAAAPVPTPPPSASAAVPSTDIYLYRLSRSFVPFRQRLINITNRPGYDNQPSFDGPAILYTSIRNGQADIYRFEDGIH